MICTELMILTHVGPFFLPVIIPSRSGMSAGRGVKRKRRKCPSSLSQILHLPYLKYDMVTRVAKADLTFTEENISLSKARGMCGKSGQKRHCSILSTVAAAIAARGEPR